MEKMKKKRSDKKVIAYPPNVHVIKFNVTLYNQSEDDVYEYVAKMQNLAETKFPPGTQGAYEIDEVVRKGR